MAPSGSEGRWSLVRPRRADGGPTETERRTALARALLDRHGVLTREAVHAEGIEGGFSAVYEVLKAMEEAGRVRRGYFVEGLGATQFALPGADDRLRGLRDADPDRPLVLAATDPANAYGAALPWPEREGACPQRAAGAHVAIRSGALLAFLGRAEHSVTSYLPDADPDRTASAESLAAALAGLVDGGARRVLLIAAIDGGPAASSPLAAHLLRAGFVASREGLLRRPKLET